MTHGSQCGWHFDQYEHECDCGTSRPRTRSYIESEINVATMRLELASESAARWHQVLFEFDAARSEPVP